MRWTRQLRRCMESESTKARFEHNPGFELLRSTDAEAIRISTATGWPFEVTTKSSLPADFSHGFAGFFFKSLTENVPMDRRSTSLVIHPQTASGKRDSKRQDS